MTETSISQPKALAPRRLDTQESLQTLNHWRAVFRNYYRRCQSGVDFLAFPPINIGERYNKIFDLRKVISQSEIQFDLEQLYQLPDSI